MHIVEFALSVIHLIETWMLRLLDVDYRDPVFAIRYIRVSACDINIVSMSQRNDGTVDYARLLRRSHINHLQSLIFDDKRVAKLNRNSFRMLERDVLH